MPEFKAPLKDIEFLMNDVFDYQGHYQSIPGYEEATPDMIDAIASECAKFCENVLSPINQSGDEEGCKWEDGKVTTPKGFKEAYDQYVAGGWQSLSHPEEYGGQGLPVSLSLLKGELMGTANWSWGMYPGLSLGAMNTIFIHGTEDQKQKYLTRLMTGEWTGTMCLTESQCGTDLGQIKTKAEPNGDGTYKLTGSKIFISAGDHDLTDNIIHIVLARLPGAPKGTRGISLFIVPKNNINEDGSVGDNNKVSCGSIEHKMGIKASSTCVINFDEAEGVLIGPENKGLECMFTFMNTARIGTAIQGVAAAELSFQGALTYAKDRMSMRALRGKQEPEKVADSIIHHADVKRMLLTQKAIAEGGRAMIYYAARFADNMVAPSTSKEEADAVDDYLGFHTPILKGCLTELGYEAANIGMQVYGGHGYIKEWGMEQIVRDTRIAMLYEGTTGIQALDLLGRKVLLGKFKMLNKFLKEIRGFCFKNGLVSGNPHKMAMRKFTWPLLKQAVKWQVLTLRLAFKANKDREMVSSASSDYLMYSGYTSMAYFWALMAQKSHEKLATNPENADFYKAKIQTAEFYFERILPRTEGLAKSLLSPSEIITDMDPEHMQF